MGVQDKFRELSLKSNTGLADLASVALNMLG